MRPMSRGGLTRTQELAPRNPCPSRYRPAYRRFEAGFTYAGDDVSRSLDILPLYRDRYLLLTPAHGPLWESAPPSTGRISPHCGCAP